MSDAFPDNMFRCGGGDPGVSGAIARITFDPETRLGTLVVHDMPKAILTTTGKQKPQPDPRGIAVLLRDLQLDLFVLERTFGMAGDAAAYAYSFGHGRGAMAGAAHALGIDLEEPTPASWKAKLAVPSDKKQAVVRANQLLPHCAAAWPLKKHHDRAEAAMLSLMGLFTRGFIPKRIDLEV